MPLEMRATEMRATRFVMPALAPVSLNLTGIVLPALKIDVPSGLIGWPKKLPFPGAWNCTVTGNVGLGSVVLPDESVAQHVTIVGPPRLKNEPETGAQVTPTGPSTSSTAVGGGQ